MDPFTAQQVFAAGDRLLEAGRPAEAVSELLKAFTGDPAFAEDLRSRLRACFVALWSGLSRDADLDEMDYVALARVHSQADQHKKTLQLLAKAGAIRPDSGDIHLCLGEAFFLQAFESPEQKPMFDRAIDHLSAAVLFGMRDTGPERMGELYYLVGSSHFFREEYDEAIENLTSATEQHPGKAEAYFFLGSALQRKGRIAEAATSLEKACAVAPDAYNLQQLGNCYLALGRHEEALEMLREARALNPELADLRRDIGVALMQRAEQAFDQQVAERLAEDGPLEEVSIADFLAREDYIEAMAELKAFVEQAKTMPDKATRDKVRLLRGTAAKALPTDRLEATPRKRRPEGFAFVGFGGVGPRVTVKDDIVRDPLTSDLDAARDRVELFQGAGERSSRDCSDLGLTWFHRQLYAAAAVAFKEALAKDPALAEVQHYLGAAWSHLGDDERSARASEEALRLGARLAEPHRDLGLFYLNKSADALPPLGDGSLDPDLLKTLNLLRAARQGAHRDKATAHFRQYLERAAVEDEFSGFLQKVVATSEGEDSTLESVFTLALNESLSRGAYAVAESLLQELEDLVGKPQKESVRDRLEEVRRLCRTDATIHHERGNLMMATHQAQRAIEDYRAALALDPRLEKAHYNLGMALYESGDTQQAFHHIQQFLDLRQAAGSKLPDFSEASPGALEIRLQWGDAAKKMQRVEHEASVLLVKLQTFLQL